MDILKYGLKTFLNCSIPLLFTYIVILLINNVPLTLTLTLTLFCRQELVFIGVDMDVVKMTAILDNCLITDEEMLQGPPVWLKLFEDPFPIANIDEEEFEDVTIGDLTQIDDDDRLDVFELL